MAVGPAPNRTIWAPGFSQPVLGVRGDKAMIAALQWRLIAALGRLIGHAHHLVLRLSPGPPGSGRRAVIVVHLPAEVSGRRGRPRIWPLRRIAEAILYMDRAGCAW